MPVAKTDRKKRSRSFKSDKNLWSTLLHQMENGTAPVTYTPFGTLNEDERREQVIRDAKTLVTDRRISCNRAIRGY